MVAGGACKAIYHCGEETGTMAANPPQYFARPIHTSTEIIHAWLEFRPNSPTDWKCFVLFVLLKLTNIYTTIPLNFIQRDLMKGKFSSTQAKHNSIIMSL